MGGEVGEPSLCGFGEGHGRHQWSWTGCRGTPGVGTWNDQPVLTDTLDRRAPPVWPARSVDPSGAAAVELVSDPLTREPDPAMTARVVALARERGLLLMAAGIYSNVIRVLVPLVAEPEQIDAGLEILDGAIADAA